MSADKNHSDQFEKYLRGEMSSTEAYEFERATLNDPFAHEALEGLEDIPADILFEDINQLKSQVKPSSKKGFNWMQIAAAVALLVVSSLAIWLSIDQIENVQELAMEEEVISEPVDSVSQDSLIQEETEELIAEAVPLNPKIDKVKKDGLRVVDTNEPVGKEIDGETIDELKSISTLQIAEAEIPEQGIRDKENSIGTVLQGKVEGVKMERSKLVGAPSVDTSELEDKALLAQTLVANEVEVQSSEMPDADSQTSKQITSERGSAARSASSSFTQNISGQVTDDSGESLPGVNVVIKGTTTGTVTDLDGNYSLTKIENMTLVFAFVGFESQEVQVGARNTLDVSMGGVTELQEVVVTAVGVSDNNPSYFPARPINGNRKFNQYIEENLVYPEGAKENEIEGTVVLALTISPSGVISDAKVKRSLGFGCDMEAIRLIKEGPKWNPAEKDGINVEDDVRVRVKFKLR